MVVSGWKWRAGEATCADCGTRMRPGEGCACWWCLGFVWGDKGEFVTPEEFAFDQRPVVIYEEMEAVCET